MKKILMGLAICVASGFTWADVDIDDNERNIKVISTHMGNQETSNPDEVVVRNNVTVGGVTYDVDTKAKDYLDGNYNINLQVFKIVDGKDVKDSEYNLVTLKNRPINMSNVETEQVTDTYSVDAEGKEVITLKNMEVKKNSILLVLKESKDKRLMLDYAFNTQEVTGRDYIKVSETSDYKMLIPSLSATNAMMRDVPLTLGETLVYEAKDFNFRYLIKVSKET